MFDVYPGRGQEVHRIFQPGWCKYAKGVVDDACKRLSTGGTGGNRVVQLLDAATEACRTSWRGLGAGGDAPRSFHAHRHERTKPDVLWLRSVGFLSEMAHWLWGCQSNKPHTAWATQQQQLMLNGRDWSFEILKRTTAPSNLELATIVLLLANSMHRAIVMLGSKNTVALLPDDKAKPITLKKGTGPVAVIAPPQLPWPCTVSWEDVNDVARVAYAAVAEFLGVPTTPLATEASDLTAHGSTMQVSAAVANAAVAAAPAPISTPLPPVLLEDATIVATAATGDFASAHNDDTTALAAEHTDVPTTPGSTLAPGQLESGPGDVPTIASLTAELQQARASLYQLQAAMELGDLSAGPSAARPVVPQQRQEITLPKTMTLRAAWQLYCCGDGGQQQEPLMHVDNDRSVQLLPKPLAGHFWKVMRFVRQAVMDVSAWHDNPTREDSLVMLRHPLLPGAVLCPGVKTRHPLEDMGLLTVRNHIILRENQLAAASNVPLPATPGVALRPQPPASSVGPLQETSSTGDADKQHHGAAAGGTGGTRSSTDEERVDEAQPTAAATTAPPAPTRTQRLAKRKSLTKASDTTTARRQKISAAPHVVKSSQTQDVVTPQPPRAAARRSKQDDGGAATENDTAATTAQGHGTRSSKQTDAAAVATMLAPVGATAGGSKKRAPPADAAVPAPKRTAPMPSPPPPAGPQQTATAMADAAGAHEHGASAVTGNEEGQCTDVVMTAAPARKRSAPDQHEGEDAPAAKRACGAATPDVSSTTDHCMFTPEAHKYCARAVVQINKYLHDRYRRRLHVVSPDGDCAFHTISFFSAIPHDVLRWMAAVATAIRVAAAAHLPPQTNAAQKAHALLAYYREELAVADARKTGKKAHKVSANVGAAVGVEDDREQTAASAAVKHIIKPREWVESSVLALVCDILGLRLAVLTVADHDDTSKWHVLPLFDTDAEYFEQIVNDSVRLAVFFRKHYSPCMLEAPVDVDLAPACLTFPQVVDVLCTEVAALLPSAWPQLVPGAVDVQVWVLCCAVMLACVWIGEPSLAATDAGAVVTRACLVVGCRAVCR